MRVQKDGEIQDLALPPGWECRMTDEGRLFFVDNRKGITQWGHPLSDSDVPSSWTRMTDAKGRVCFVETVGRQRADGKTEYKKVYYNPADPPLVQKSRDELVRVMLDVTQVMDVPISDIQKMPEKMNENQVCALF